VTTLGGDRRARVWEVATGREVRDIPMARTGYPSLVVAHSPDGQGLLLGNSPWNGQVTTVRAGRKPVLRDYGNTIQSAACSPDGRLEAIGDSRGRVILWDVPANKALDPPLPAHNTVTARLAFSPDSTRLAAGGSDGLVTVWDVAGRVRTFRGQGHTAAVTSLVFSADGKALASGSADGTAKLWNLGTTGDARILGEHQASLRGVAYSPDGRWLATAGDDVARLWDAVTGRPVRELPVKNVVRVAFAPDSRTVATGGGDRRVRLWDVATGRAVGTPLTGHPPAGPNRPQVGSLAFSPDGTKLAAGFGWPGWRSDDYDQVIQVWEVGTAREVGTLSVRNTVSSLAFSPDGTLLAAACHDGTVRLWATGTWNVVRTLPVGEMCPAVAFSPDGRTLAAGKSGGVTGADLTRSRVHEIKLWDVATGREVLAPLKGHLSRLTAVVFSPDGKTLVSASEDRTVRLWDVATGRALRTLRGHTDGVNDAALSPDGNTLATVGYDKTVRLWAAASPAAVAAGLAEDRDRDDRRAAFDRDQRARAERRPAVLADEYRRAGFIQDWLILAPIPLNEGESGAAGVDREQVEHEADLRPTAGEKVRVAGSELVWKTYRADGAAIDFNGFLGRQTERSVAYAVCYVESDADRADLELRVGSDDQAKVYLHGRQKHKFLPGGH
jgi:WD40 repeat protein